MARTYDQKAVEILMGSGSEEARQAQLTNLASQARAALENRFECPECGNLGPHQDNGRVGVDRAFCCANCGSHFDNPFVKSCCRDPKVRGGRCVNCGTWIDD